MNFAESKGATPCVSLVSKRGEAVTREIEETMKGMEYFMLVAQLYVMEVQREGAIVAFQQRRISGNPKGIWEKRISLAFGCCFY